MKEIKDSCIYKMSKDNKPALSVKSGEEVVFYTRDCFNNQITSEEQKVEFVDWDCINPATGPLYIEEAEPGDTLKVTIERLEVEKTGVMAAIPGDGVLGKDFEESQIKLIQVENQIAHFNDEIDIPCTPMIGVIGVAPLEGEIPCGEPGNHGGNMDNTKISEGAVLYFPVSVKGALLAMGDVHANMGDGEIMVTGIEIPAKVTVKVEVVKQKEISIPFMENAEYFYTIASDTDLEHAIYIATSEMCNYICKQKNYTIQEAGMLMSAVGDLEICQVVDPKRTVRFKMAKKYL